MKLQYVRRHSITTGVEVADRDKEHFDSRPASSFYRPISASRCSVIRFHVRCVS
jgi:hypothetical protein